MLYCAIYLGEQKVAATVETETQTSPPSGNVPSLLTPLEVASLPSQEGDSNYGSAKYLLHVFTCIAGVQKEADTTEMDTQTSPLSENVQGVFPVGIGCNVMWRCNLVCI